MAGAVRTQILVWISLDLFLAKSVPLSFLLDVFGRFSWMQGRKTTLALAALLQSCSGLTFLSKAVTSEKLPIAPTGCRKWQPQKPSTRNNPQASSPSQNCPHGSLAPCSSSRTIKWTYRPTRKSLRTPTPTLRTLTSQDCFGVSSFSSRKLTPFQHPEPLLWAPWCRLMHNQPPFILSQPQLCLGHSGWYDGRFWIIITLRSPEAYWGFTKCQPLPLRRGI